MAQYTSILYKRFRERNHQINVITFKRQYPKLLFPGKTQLDMSQDESLKIETDPMLDSIGPWTWFRAYKKVQCFQPNLVIFQYWMPFFAPCFGSIGLLTRRFTNTKILYLCHNVIPHERHPGDLTLARFALRQADFFIVQSDVVKRELLQLLPHANYKVVPHPVYEIFGQPMDKREAKKQLNIEAENVLLFFGYIRAYKGLDLLLEAMPDIIKTVDLKLLVVGEFYDDENKYRQMLDYLQINEHVHIVSDFVPNETVNLYFSASDVVVLPYKSATQSGIVQIAYNLNKPCIVTDVGGLSEVVIHDHTGYVVEPNAPEELAKAVARFYAEDKQGEFSENVKREKEKYSWDNMVKAIEEFVLPKN